MGRFYSDLRAGSALSSQHFAGVPSWFWLHLVQEISNGIRQSLRSKRSQILTIAARHGARKVRVFGSVVHGAARRNSDIDVLVDMEESRRLLDHAALVFDLE